jgi:hypothetical protein
MMGAGPHHRRTILNKPAFLEVELLQYGGARDIVPDCIRLELTADFLVRVNRSLLALSAMSLDTAEVVLPLNQPMELTLDGNPLPALRLDAGTEQFLPVTGWLKVQSHMVGVEILDGGSEDRVRGAVQLSSSPELCAALRAARGGTSVAMAFRLSVPLVLPA